eukprot:354767-Chlamydomonas_euryale.AAC.5
MEPLLIWSASRSLLAQVHARGRGAARTRGVCTRLFRLSLPMKQHAVVLTPAGCHTFEDLCTRGLSCARLHGGCAQLHRRSRSGV